MAIGTATMTITISESVDMAGSGLGDTSTSTVKTIVINDIYKRIITVPTSEVQIYDTHDSNVAGSTFDDDLVKYVRITNQDTSNIVILRVKNADHDEFAYKLGPLETFLLWQHEATLNALDAGTLDIGAGWGDIASVKLTSPDGASDCEIMIVCSES
tara:strand:+ start:94 stop:564 length:471 start_codon:yes stop_codon:yes gene_type:complete